MSGNVQLGYERCYRNMLQIIKDDIWEALVSDGISALEQIDAGRWIIGDNALAIDTVYGQNSIETYSLDIGAEYSRVRQYRSVSGFWHKETSPRLMLLEECPTLSWTHFREAMRLKTPERAAEFLDTCASNAWNITRARVELDKIIKRTSPAEKWVDTELRITSMPNCRVVFTLTPDQHAKLIDPDLDGRKVRLCVYEVQDGTQPPQGIDRPDPATSVVEHTGATPVRAASLA